MIDMGNATWLRVLLIRGLQSVQSWQASVRAGPTILLITTGWAGPNV